MRTDLVLKVWFRSRFRGRAAAWSGRSAFEGGWVKRWNLADLIFSSDLLLNLCLNLFSFLHPPLILLSFSFFQFQFALLTWHGNMFVLCVQRANQRAGRRNRIQRRSVWQRNRPQIREHVVFSLKVMMMTLFHWLSDVVSTDGAFLFFCVFTLISLDLLLWSSL